MNFAITNTWNSSDIHDEHSSAAKKGDTEPRRSCHGVKRHINNATESLRNPWRRLEAAALRESPAGTAISTALTGRAIHTEGDDRIIRPSQWADRGFICNSSAQVLDLLWTGASFQGIAPTDLLYTILYKINNSDFKVTEVSHDITG